MGYFEGGTTYATSRSAPTEKCRYRRPQAGAVYTLNGGSDGPANHTQRAETIQGASNEAEAGDRLGTALAFGNVDESGKGALMVGAPGNDNNTGCVHVIAPWRQTYGLECQHSVVTDCEGNLIFTQKPFDQVWIASTTKTMTVLLASERTRLPVGDPKRMSLDDEYVVPSWCAWDIPGSLVPLRSGETMTLRELMWTCLFMSGNDAAFAIADLCEGSGGPNTSVPNFIAAMNAKAAALGMNGTHFHNPAGLDNEPVGPELGEHYSTPHDMMLLSRAAMEDDLVREIVGSTEFTMTRRYAGGINVEQTFHSFFTGVLGNAIQPMNGIKGGSTPRAQATGLFSGGVPGRGDALVTTFLTPNNGTQYISDAAHLMQLGTRECDFDFTYSQSPFQVYYLGELSTCQQCIEGQALELDYGPPGDLVIDAIQTVGQQILGRLEVTHIMEGNLPNGGSVQIGIGPFQDRSEITIHNMSDTATEILFAPSAGGTAVPYQIPAQGFVTVPPFASASGLAQYTATISDIGTGRLSTPISIETTYGFEINASAATGGTPGFSTTLERDPGLFNENLSVTMFGHDPVGGTVLLAAHPNGATVDVPETEGDGPDVIDTASAVADLRVGPNPFKESSTLRFRLTQSAHVETSIYDAVARSAPQTSATSRWVVAVDLGRSG
ncbi:MAG: hypothetical protein R3E12_18000 [Candidatus Eisenbacteria bacterium]